MFKKIAIAAASLAFIVSTTTVQAASTITAYTAVLPPYTLGADQTNPGISHELIVEMASRAGVELQVKYMPWKRAQTIVQETPNTLLFTATRSAAREPLYGWVALMAEPNEVFVTTEGTIEDYENASDLKAVVVLDGTPRHRRLSENGLSNIETAQEAKMAARMLNAGRVGAWYTFDQRAAAVFKAEGMDPGQLVFGPALNQPKNWLASNLEFDPAVAERLAAALDEMRADGTYDKILAKYTQ